MNLVSVYTHDNWTSVPIECWIYMKMMENRLAMESEKSFWCRQNHDGQKDWA